VTSKDLISKAMLTYLETGRKFNQPIDKLSHMVAYYSAAGNRT
jgi:hypothetical protein